MTFLKFRYPILHTCIFLASVTRRVHDNHDLGVIFWIQLCPSLIILTYSVDITASITTFLF